MTIVAKPAKIAKKYLFKQKVLVQKIAKKSVSSVDSLILFQHLSQVSKEKYESEVNETLEMTKILDWDDDNFFDVENQIEQEKKPTQDFDDDSFWENYDFESVLDWEKKIMSDNGILICVILHAYRGICCL